MTSQRLWRVASQWYHPALLAPLGGYCQIFCFIYFCTKTSVEVAKLASRSWLLCATHLNIIPAKNISYDTTINNLHINLTKKSLWRVRMILWLLFHSTPSFPGAFLLHFWGICFFCGGLGFFSLQVFITILKNTKDNSVKPCKQCEQCDKLGLITMSPWE